MKIEFEFNELQKLIAERDAMKARIAELESQPLSYSFEWVAKEVHNELCGRSYTPSQLKQIYEFLKNGCKQTQEGK